jgi:hypothetical protein
MTRANYGRVGATVSDSLLTGASPAVENLLKTLSSSGILTFLDHLHSNPYPKPLADDHPLTPFTGTYPRIQADPPYRVQ